MSYYPSGPPQLGPPTVQMRYNNLKEDGSLSIGNKILYVIIIAVIILVIIIMARPDWFIKGQVLTDLSDSITTSITPESVLYKNLSDTTLKSLKNPTVYGEIAAAGSDTIIKKISNDNNFTKAVAMNADFKTYVLQKLKEDSTMKGLKGDPGIQGIPGLASTIPGPVGPKGDPGIGLNGDNSTVPGPKGDNGDKGDKGDVGAASTIPGPAGAGIDYSTVTDFILGTKSSPERGVIGVGRALVRGNNSKLIVNYDNDYSGGVSVLGNTTFANDVNISGNLKVNGLIGSPIDTLIGPFIIKNKDGNCWDSGQNNNKLGFHECNNNSYQQFKYNPFTMQLVNVQKNKCFKYDSSSCSWADCNVDDEHQRVMRDNANRLQFVQSGNCISLNGSDNWQNCDERLEQRAYFNL